VCVSSERGHSVFGGGAQACGEEKLHPHPHNTHNVETWKHFDSCAESGRRPKTLRFSCAPITPTTPP